MIEPAKNNDKLESPGHSMIYVHEADAAYFYDNNVGLEKIPEIDGIEKGKFLYERLLTIHKIWDIPSTRFYRLKEAL